MLTQLASLLMVALPLVPTEKPADAPANKGLAELQGTWKLTSVERNGEAALDLSDRQPRCVIKEDKLMYGGEVLASLNVDASTSPKIIDLRFLKPERTCEAIFTLEKDTLKICLNRQTEGAKERPDAFITKDQESWRLLVFMRVKGERPDAMEGLTGFVGIAIRKHEDQPEVIISSALENSPAKKAGLQKDDVVLKVAGAEVKELKATIDAVRQAKPGSDLVLRIRRDGKESDITVKVGVLPFHFLAQLD